MDIPNKVIQHVLYLLSGQLPVQRLDKPTRSDQYKQTHRGPWSSAPWLDGHPTPTPGLRRGSWRSSPRFVPTHTRMGLGDAARTALYAWRGKNISEAELTDAIVDITRAVDALKAKKRRVTRSKATRDAAYDAVLARSRRERLNSDQILRRARRVAGRLVDDDRVPVDEAALMARFGQRAHTPAARNGVQRGGPLYAERQWFSSETAYDQLLELRRCWLIEKRIWFVQLMLIRLGYAA